MCIITPSQSATAFAHSRLAQGLVVAVGVAMGALLLLQASWPDDRTSRVLAWFPGDAARAGALAAITRLGGAPIVSRFNDHLWLVELPDATARDRLGAAGAWLVLDGSRFAGCAPTTAPGNALPTQGDLG